MKISGYFYDVPGGALDTACHSIFQARGAKFIGAGTMFVGRRSGERDVEYDVPEDKVDETRIALKHAGFRMEPTPCD